MFSFVWVHKCLYFTRLSVSFKLPNALSSVFCHNACLFHVFLQSRFCIVTRFPPSGVTMRVFYSRFCIVLDALRVFLFIVSQCVYFTRLSVSFRKPYAFSSVFCYNASVFHVTMHTRFFLCIVSQCLYFTRSSVSFKTPYAFSSVLRHNVSLFHVFLHWRFFIVSDALRVFLCIASQCVCFFMFLCTGVSLFFKTPCAFS